MNHDYTPKEIADTTVQASYQHPELRGLDIPPLKDILDALPEPTILPRDNGGNLLRDNGGELPPGLEYVTNTSGRDIPVYATKLGQVKATGWNINKGRIWNPALGQYPPWYAIRGGKIRTCRVWKDKDRTTIGQVMKTFGFLPPWRWACRLCGVQSAGQTWKLAYATANHHARNHHRSK